MFTRLAEILEAAKKGERKRIAMVGAEDVEGLKALKKVQEEGIADVILIGSSQSRKEAEKIGLRFEFIEASDSEEAAYIGAKVVGEDRAHVLMKGLVKTSTLLKAVLDPSYGLRKGRLLSHVAVIESPILNRLLLLSDGGMVIRPTLEQKVGIIENAVTVARKLGIEEPKVACIAAVEVVNPDMPETLEAAALAQMNRRGQIKGCVVDGPLGLDNALSEFAAAVKRVEGKVAGNADVLVVPDIHSGNFLGKSVVYLAGGKIAGVVVGASAPVVIVSRADTAESKLYSIALGIALS
ncbi:MAG: phosphate butyryltransferase [Thermotogae bacterium]|nr:MAG: phosphate butyryltransferase [Thermotogota bacterium]